MSVVATQALDGTRLDRPNANTASNDTNKGGIMARVAEMLGLWRVRLQALINLIIHMEHTLM